MSADNSGPAFPSNRDMAHDSKYAYAPGISIRDYFAAKAMHALLHNASAMEGAWHVEAKAAYAIADAMLAARAKP